MNYRELGTTGIRLSEIGFGTWGIGGATAGATSYGAVDDGASKRALDRAVAAGITFFDTAAAYGDGHSEIVLGRAFKGRRDSVVIATKAGLDSFATPPDFSAARIKASLHASLGRLQTDHVDILQLHNPAPADLAANDELLGLLDRLRRDGKVRALGLSVKAPGEAPELARLLRPDVVQMNYNLLDHRAAETGALDWARREGVGVIARTPLCFGFLTGAIDEATEFAPDDHRAAWPRQQILRWIEGGRRMREGLGLYAEEPAAVTALRFCLSDDVVTTAIPGMLTAAEVDVNTAASDLGPLPAATLEAALRIYATVDPMAS